VNRSLSCHSFRARALLAFAVAACAGFVLAGLTAPASAARSTPRAIAPAITNPFSKPIAYAGSEESSYPFCADIVPVNPLTNSFGTPLDVPTPNCPGTEPEAYAIAVTPSGRVAYVVVNEILGCADGYLVPVNLVSGAAGKPIPVGDLASYNSQSPGGIAITPDGTTAYVSDSCGDTVTPVDLATGAAGTPITVGANPEGIAIAPDGETAYVTNGSGNTVTPIDLATGTAETRITVGAAGSDPDSIALTPDGSTAYVTLNGSDAVMPINLASGTAGSAIPIGMSTFPDSIAITPDGATAYVANFFGNSVTPVNLATQTAGTPIDLPGFNFPESIAIDPDGSVAYTADNQSGLVTPINLATNTAGAAEMLPGDTSQVVTFGPGWVNRDGLNLGNTSLPPSLILHGRKLYAAVTTSRGRISYAARTGQRWSRPAQIKGSWGRPRTSLPPALASYKGKLYAFWTAAAGGDIRFSAFNGTTWARPGTLSGRWGTALSAAGPTVTVSLGSLVAAWRGRATHSVYYSELTQAGWSEKKLIAGSVTDYAPAVAPLPLSPNAQGLVAIAWTEPSGQVGYGQINLSSGFEPQGTVPEAHTDAAPALAYAGSAADGTLYVAWKNRSNMRVSYSAMFDAAQPLSHPSGWTAPESQPQAETAASPALAAVGYDLYLAWASRTTSHLFYSFAENPY
jgi:YVTN family beta-propeller protein